MDNQTRRLELQEELEGYFADDTRVDDPSEHVSFQPPEGTQIKYPHIVYSRDPGFTFYADNTSYIIRAKYELQYIDRNPDSPMLDILVQRSYCSHKSSFIEEGLYHSVFDLYH